MPNWICNTGAPIWQRMLGNRFTDEVFLGNRDMVRQTDTENIMDEGREIFKENKNNNTCAENQKRTF